MGNSKHALATGAAILGIAVALLFWQKSKASGLRGELDQLAKRHDAAERQLQNFHEARALFGEAPMPGAHTAKKLLAHANGPLDVDALFTNMTETATSRDMLGKMKTFLPMAKMGKAEYEQLVAKMANYTGPQHYKGQIELMLAQFAPSDVPAKSLGQLLDLEVSPHAYGHLASGWASKDPDAALAWFREQRDSGKLEGRSASNSPEESLFADILGGISKSDPAKAIDLFKEMNDKVIGDGNSAAHAIATGIGAAMKEGGDDSQLRRLLDWDASGRLVQGIVSSALAEAAEGKDFAAVTSFVESYAEKDSDREQIIAAYLMHQDAVPLEERIANLSSYLPKGEESTSIRHLVTSGLIRLSERDARAWVETQPEGVPRDLGLSTTADRARSRSDMEGALADIEQISDKDFRDNELRSLARIWVGRDIEAARAALPADLIDAVSPKK